MADVDLSEDSLRSLSNDSALLCRLIDLVLITVSQGAGFSPALPEIVQVSPKQTAVSSGQKGEID
jgi:hypothetical protein